MPYCHVTCYECHGQPHFCSKLHDVPLKAFCWCNYKFQTIFPGSLNIISTVLTLCLSRHRILTHPELQPVREAVLRQTARHQEEKRETWRGWEEGGEERETLPSSAAKLLRGQKREGKKVVGRRHESYSIKTSEVRGSTCTTRPAGCGLDHNARDTESTRRIGGVAPALASGDWPGRGCGT